MNAKELILAKINATTKFADFYTYLLTTGESFKDIAEIMVSPIINVVSKFATENIYDSYSKAITPADSIAFILNEKTLPIIDDFTFKNWMLWTGYEPITNASNKNKFKVDSESIIGKILFGTENKRDINTEQINADFKNLIVDILEVTGVTNLTDDNILTECANFIRTLEKPWGEGYSNEIRTRIVKKILDGLTDPLMGDKLKELIIKNLKLRTPNQNVSADTQEYTNNDFVYEDYTEEFYDYDGVPDFDDPEAGLWNEYNFSNLSEVNFNIKDIKPEQYRQLYRYFTEFVFKKDELINDIVKKQLEVSPDLIDPRKKLLSSLDHIREKIIPGAKELQLLGRFLGINQGMKTNDFQEYSWIRNLECEINRIYKNAKKELEFEPFDLLRFLDDESYRNSQINQYEQVKTTFNILKVVTTASNFYEMLKMLGVARKSISRSAAIKLERKLAYDVIADKQKTMITKDGENVKLLITSADTSSLNRKEFNTLTKYVQDVLILNWISTLKDKKITLPVQGEYYNSEGKWSNFSKGIEPAKRTISLNSTENAATFKMWMEKVVIPKLKELNPDNSFLSALNLDFNTNRKHKVIRTFYTLPIDMGQIRDDVKTQERYNDYLNSFSKISKEKLPENFYGANNGKLGETANWTIGELLFMYNAIVHKNSMSRNSLTRIFVDLNSENSYGIIRDWQNFISEIDNNEEAYQNLKYNINDLKYRLSDKNTKLKFKVQDVYTDKKMAGVDFYDMQNPSDTPTRKIVPKDTYFSDFTFNMPFMDGEKIEVSVNPKTIVKDYDKTYTPKLNDGEIIDIMIDQLKNMTQNSIKIEKISSNDLQAMFNNEKYGNYSPIQFNKSEDILRNMMSSSAFIYNNTVYINTDHATAASPVHEFAHIIFANMKFNKNEDIRNKFYDMLKMIKETSEYKQILEELTKKPAYANLKGSDLQEEVLVHLLEQLFYTGFESKLGSIKNITLNNLKENVVNIVEQLLGIDSINAKDVNDLGTTSIGDLMTYFKSKLLVVSGSLDSLAIPTNQLLSNIKSNLAKDDKITWTDC